MIRVRPAERTDARPWLALRRALWPDGSETEHREEIERYFAGGGGEQAVLLAQDASGRIIGFVEMSIRGYAEGCRSDRVAYVEGWLVVPEARGRGTGRALIDAAEDWGRSRGCEEMASDTQPDNAASTAAHRALGFHDVGLVRCFWKAL